MRIFLKSLQPQNMGEMETHISLTAKSYAQIFTISALSVWVIYDLIQAAIHNNSDGNILPWLILVGTFCTEDIAKRIMTKEATQDDEEYRAEQQADRPRRIILGVVVVIASAVAAVFIASALHYAFI